MALLYPSTGVADPIKFGNSLLALDVAASTVLGMGVITGLLVSGAGLVATGDALIGHVVTLGTAFNAAPLLIASSTNYVYLQMPASPICPDRTGKDPGVVVVTTSATPPANAVLLATITTGAASAITAVNTAPSTRRNLTLPLALLDLRSVGPYNAGTTYQAGNIVGYSGGGYIAKIVSTGVTPVEGTSWGLVASAGATGATGPTGAAGTATLAADTDVQLTSIADADLLTWSATASKWVNRALALLGLTNSVPSAETSGAAGSAGTATTAARADHVHAMPTAFPPSAHATSHAVAGADALSATSIGALAASNNLSDLASASAARTNLALGTAAITNVPASGNASASQVVLGNDTRLTSTGVSLSGVNPPAETVGATAAVGSAATAARADHSHAMPGVFGVSGAGHAAGFVPDPGATAGSVNFLREDGTWVTPAGGGTLTAVSLSVPGLLYSAATTYASGAATITESLLTQGANKVLAGPTTGAAAAPTLRSLVTADIPAALAGTGLTSTAGVLSVTPTAVAAGSYTSTNLTVGADGRITAASNGSGGGGAAPTGTDTQTLSYTGTTLAATSNQLVNTAGQTTIGGAIDTTSRLSVNPQATGENGLSVNMPSGATGYAWQVKNSTGAVIGQLSASGLKLVNIGGRGQATLLDQNGVVFQGYSNFNGAWADSVQSGFFQVPSKEMFTDPGGSAMNRLGFCALGVTIGNYGYNTLPAPTAMLDVRGTAAFSGTVTAPALNATTAFQANGTAGITTTLGDGSAVTGGIITGVHTTTPGFILTIPGAIATGADTLEVLLPSWYSSRALTRLSASLGAASTSGSVTLTAQLATATGVFTAAQTSDTITLASGVYQGTPVTSFTAGLTGSGENRVRLNITGAGTGASNLTVKFEF